MRVTVLVTRTGIYTYIHSISKTAGSSNSKIKVMFTLERATKAQRGIDVYLYFFFNLGVRCGWVVKATLRPLYPRERDFLPIV
jgi:magnesium-transporting ATPase (P-type)